MWCEILNESWSGPDCSLTAHWLLTDCSLLRARIEYSDQSVCREESLRSANLDSEAQTQIQSTSRIDTKNVSIEQYATFFSLATGQTLYPLIGCSWHRHGHLNLLTLLVSGALSLHWQSDSGTPGHWSVSMEIISGWHIPAIVNYEPDSRAYYCSNYAAISDEWSGLTVTASRSGRQLLLITEQTVEWEQWGSEAVSGARCWPHYLDTVSVTLIAGSDSYQASRNQSF